MQLWLKTFDVIAVTSHNMTQLLTSNTTSVSCVTLLPCHVWNTTFKHGTKSCCTTLVGGCWCFAIPMLNQHTVLYFRLVLQIMFVSTISTKFWWNLKQSLMSCNNSSVCPSVTPTLTLHRSQGNKYIGEGYQSQRKKYVGCRGESTSVAGEKE